jgi:soluble lytic murein transglycosylase-like protein
MTATKSKLLLGGGIILLVLGSLSPLAAEPCLRVTKGGVVYYYFSHREKYQTRRAAVPPGKSPAVAPAVPQLSGAQLEPFIQQAAGSHNLPSSLIKAVIRVESNFHPGATSPKGAQGLMQLMPGTAEGLQVKNPYDAQENIFGGTQYLSMLLEKYNNNLPLALAAYNAGPQRVDRCQSVPSIKETQNFVRQVCDQFLKYGKE